MPRLPRKALPSGKRSARSGKGLVAPAGGPGSPTPWWQRLRQTGKALHGAIVSALVVSPWPCLRCPWGAGGRKGVALQPLCRSTPAAAGTRPSAHAPGGHGSSAESTAASLSVQPDCAIEIIAFGAGCAWAGGCFCLNQEKTFQPGPGPAQPPARSPVPVVVGARVWQTAARNRKGGAARRAPRLRTPACAPPRPGRARRRGGS